MIDLAERCDYIPIKDKLNGKASFTKELKAACKVQNHTLQAAFVMLIFPEFYLRISFIIFKNFSFISGLPRLTRFIPT